MLKRILLIVTGLLGSAAMIKGLLSSPTVQGLEETTFNYNLWVGLSVLLIAGLILMFIEIQSDTQK